MTNTDLWDRVERTDPAAVKRITGKQYEGNSPKPYYIVRRLTEEFGPCGIGWGFSIVSERMERMTQTDVLHIAVVRLWYSLNGQRGEVEQIGQTKACYEKSKGGMLVDEDAPKKSVTDALVKCASYLGFAGDIFAGRWDDSKYVDSLRAEFSKPDGMSDQIVSEWIAYIDESTSSKVLMSRVQEAVNAAQEVKDEAAVAKFHQASARKMEAAKARRAA